MSISVNKQNFLYAKVNQIRLLLEDIQILQKITLIGKIRVPYVKGQIQHLKNVENMSQKDYKMESWKLNKLIEKLSYAKEKMLDYYD